MLNGVLWILGTGAQWRELPERYPPFQTCHRRFQQWVQARKLEKALRLLARYLRERGKLDLQEAFVDATFAGAKKGALPSGQRGGERARRFLLSPPVIAFHSRYLSKALHHTKANLSKKSLLEASWKNSQPGSSVTKPMTQTRSTRSSKKNTMSN